MPIVDLSVKVLPMKSYLYSWNVSW